ncbi:MAG: hypothetical protein K9J16_04430 [Melioribacteraceae bacterium]|nr:hypothetical protein [Melioribacteraceae bacterium]MCF8354763.1 hypothetical protein [Melioribacteraceae bacterium]MCF8394388.1 hypothetical protein [Melioribacteraceae bacterium]MCF8417516.1 hypothetical protein [Melioribacteraceae bacterium]
MKKKFDKDEKDLLNKLNNGELQSKVDIEKRRKELSAYARNALRKDKRVNIRISERDLLEIQRRAYEDGLPYQTLIASILHKFVNGKLVDQSTGIR